MNNDMTLYRIALDGVTRLSDGAFIPNHPGNRDYQSYLAWCAAGNEAEPLHSLSEAQALKLIELDTACAAAIRAGFDSDALGQPHHYPAKLTDQSNLQAAVLASLQPDLPMGWTTPVWCQYAAGAWAYRYHTAAQIQKVGIASKDAINACIARKIEREHQVAKATTLDEVKAILW
ncbi:hypothetical protein QE440_001286 [Pseudomonas psychrotolerans]|uniref:DUF4376 domain-containing protein n=2 Tax=Pseudomonas oryzihabitans TaxID=47885 RepID=A0AAJ2BJI0_9PSED|nr:hypothetical protein [Pseudomonas psychrotolerans]